MSGIPAGDVVRCWGHNAAGQLGNGSTTDSSTPVLVSGIKSAMAVAAGGDFACSLLPDRTVVCWGNNEHGQLGDGTTTSGLEPVPVAGLQYVDAISAGSDFACARTNHQIVCWGHNVSGELGSDSGVDSPTPVTVGGLTGGVYAFSTGRDSSCASAGGVGVACWGSNTSGQLGNGTTISSAAPVLVLGMASYPNALAVGGGSACAVDSQGAVACWGSNTYGQLGNNSTMDSLVPVPVVGFP
jgi:alpha-tubulin suppressor-like RCC1 family protein